LKKSLLKAGTRFFYKIPFGYSYFHI